jgi:hypothetical protein
MTSAAAIRQARFRDRQRDDSSPSALYPWAATYLLGRIVSASDWQRHRRPPMSDAGIIYKTHNALDRDAGNSTDGSLVGYDDQEPFTEEQQDIICRLVAMMNSEMRMDLDDHSDAIASLRERLAAVEASLNTMMTLLSSTTNGINGTKTIEASETKTNVVRKLHVSER